MITKDVDLKYPVDVWFTDSAENATLFICRVENVHELRRLVAIYMNLRVIADDLEMVIQDQDFENKTYRHEKHGYEPRPNVDEGCETCGWNETCLCPKETPKEEEK